jgi:hypothetical protein
MSFISRKLVEKWQNELDSTKQWMDYELDENGNLTSVKCKLCFKFVDNLKIHRNFNDSFIKGVNVLKKDNLVKHVKSIMHQTSLSLENKPKTVNEFYSSTSLGKSLTKSKNEETERIEKLIDIAYFINKEELPLTKFSSIVNLEKKHGVKLGTSYGTRKACTELTEIIGYYFKDNLKEVLNRAKYFSIFLDGATDKSVTEKEVFFIKYFAETEVVTSFLALKDVEDGTAKGLKDVFDKTLKDMGLDFKNNLVGLATDGARVNLGHKKGLATLIKTECPWLVIIHCFSHRLELAIKDFLTTSYFDKVLQIMNELFKFYDKSPKRFRGLKDLAKIMGKHASKPSRVIGTRWISHIEKAVEQLQSSYEIIITQLENISVDPSYKTEKSKVEALLKNLKKKLFVLHLIMLNKFLKPLSQLSLTLQKETIDFPLMIASVQLFYGALENLKTSVPNEINEILSQEQENCTYKNILLSNQHTKNIDYKMKCIEYLTKIHECVYERFLDIDKNQLFSSLKILDFALWPSTINDLENFGNDDINFFITYFKDLLDRHIEDRNQIYQEWQVVKIFWHNNLKHTNTNWGSILKMNSKFPNLVNLAKILLLFPISNAVVERSFSTMNRIKTKARNSLNEEHLEAMMAISEGPSCENFDSSNIAPRFFTLKERRPTYQRKRKRSEDSDEVEEI